jgi:imidazoleglycerol phosphate dehydratase HisB
MYYSFKKIKNNHFSRKTKEVEIEVSITNDGKNIILNGKGDLGHHLIEDSYILLKKVLEIEYHHSTN